MGTSKRVIGVGAGLLLLAAPVVASAASGFFDVGQSTYILPANGTYWQDGFQYHFKDHDLYLRGGIDFAATQNTHFRLSAFSLGSYSLDALAVADDKVYNKHAPTHCNGPCPPLHRYVTEGRTYGVAATVDFPHLFGSNAGVEFGPTLFRQSMSVDVTSQPHEHIAPLHIPTMRQQRSALMMAAHYDWGRTRFAITYYHLGVDYAKTPQYDAVLPSGVERALAFSIGYSF